MRLRFRLVTGKLVIGSWPPNHQLPITTSQLSFFKTIVPFHLANAGLVGGVPVGAAFLLRNEMVGDLFQMINDKWWNDGYGRKRLPTAN